MPREKGRPGHAVVQDNSDTAIKYRKVGDLVPVIEHLRRCLNNQPDYFGMSESLDDAQDELVLDILESEAGSPVRISLLFRGVLSSPAELGELSIHMYSSRPVEVVKVREVELTRGFVALVDAEDFESVSQFEWEASFSQNVYAFRRLKNDDGRTVRESLHDFLMRPAKGSRVEHIDGDMLNNTRQNLRVEITPTEDESNQDDPNCLSVGP